MQKELLISLAGGEDTRRRMYLTSIVAAGTAWDDSGQPFDTGIRCREARGSGRCRGYLRVGRDVARDEIHWRCARCRKEGTLINWRGSDGDLRRVSPLPPWAVGPVAGMSDDYVRMRVSPRELQLLQNICGIWEDLWNVVFAARRDGSGFVIVGPESICRHLSEELREAREAKHVDPTIAYRVRLRLMRARRAARARRAQFTDGPGDRVLELGEGPLRN
jgi:hypothetical protein